MNRQSITRGLLMGYNRAVGWVLVFPVTFCIHLVRTPRWAMLDAADDVRKMIEDAEKEGKS